MKIDKTQPAAVNVATTIADEIETQIAARILRQRIEQASAWRLAADALPRQFPPALRVTFAIN